MTRRTTKRTRSEPPAPREGGIPGSPSTTTSFTRTTTTTTTRCVPTRPTTTRSSSASSFASFRARRSSTTSLDRRPWRILRTRHLLWYYWWWLVGGCRLWLATSVSAASTVDGVYEVPTFSLSELRQLGESSLSEKKKNTPVAQRLHHVLTTTGLLSIALEDHDTLQSSTGVWQDLCACRHALEDLAAAQQSQPPPDHTTNGGVMHGRLSDGVTWRTTLATATVGSQSPLPLIPSWMEWDEAPHNTNGPASSLCQGPALVAGLEAVRDSVSVATQAFVTAWDALVLEQQHQQSSPTTRISWLHDATHTSYSSLASIQEAAVHLEHFHVYHKPPLGTNNNQEPETTQSITGNAASSRTRHNPPRPASLPWHTDAGLFLSFVPGHTCQEEEEESDQNQASSSDALWIHHPVTGQAQPAHFRPHTIGIMLGVGAQEWLSLSSSSSSSFHDAYNYRATKHAVVMEPGQVRAWYGMSTYFSFVCVCEETVCGVSQVRTLLCLLYMCVLSLWCWCSFRIPTTTVTMVPDTAVVQRHPERTFAQMKQQLSFVSSSSSLQPSDDTSMVIGCGSAVSTLTPDDDDSSLAPTADHDTTTNHRLRRRRLLQVQTAQACNNVTNFYCWMSCLDIPNARDRDVYLAQGYHLYCMDPHLYDRHASIEEAVQPCQGGSILNPSCVGKWTNNDPNYQVWAYDLQSQQHGQEHSPQQAQLSQSHGHNHHDGTTYSMNEKSGHSSHKGGGSKTSNMLDDDAIRDQPETAGKDGDTSSSSSSMGHNHGNHGGMDSAFASSSTFCVGGTSMYMQGFSWQEPACVIFLLPHWVLTTPTKFAMASIATIVLGCILEWILSERRKLIKELPHGPNRIVWASGLYAIQLFLGYILMLIVMTYNAILYVQLSHTATLMCVCGYSTRLE